MHCAFAVDADQDKMLLISLHILISMSWCLSHKQIDNYACDSSKAGTIDPPLAAVLVAAEQHWLTSSWMNLIIPYVFDATFHTSPHCAQSSWNLISSYRNAHKDLQQAVLVDRDGHILASSTAR